MTNENKYGPGYQIIVFFIATVFLLIYVSSPFENDDYNKLALAFSIFNYAWLGTIIIRYLFFIYNKGAKSVKGILLKVPYGLKCYFGEADCEEGNITIFGIIHFIGYFLIGYFIPDYYGVIIIISIACEFLELGMKYQPKFIIDPVINLLGYTLGSAISKF